MTNEDKTTADNQQASSSSSHASTAGRWRKKARSILLYLPVAIIVSLTFRAVVGKTYRMMTDAVEPAIPQGSRMFVYRLASEYKPGDIIICKGTNRSLVARVKTIDRDGDTIVIERKGEADATISFSDVVGKIVWNTR